MLGIIHRVVLKTKNVHRTLPFHYPFLPLQTSSFTPSSIMIQLSSFSTSAENRALKKERENNTSNFVDQFEKKAKTLLYEKNIAGFGALMINDVQSAREEQKNEALAQRIQAAAMYICVRFKQREVALAIGRAMISSGITLHRNSKKALLITMMTNEKYQDFVELYEKIEGYEFGMKYFYLTSLNHIGEFKKTLLLFNKLKGQDRSVYRSALVASSKLADVATTKVLIKTFTEKKWSFDFRTLNYAIVGALQSQEYDQAMEWHTLLRDSSLMSHKHSFVYSELIHHFEEEQEWEKVIAICEECINDDIVLLPLKSVPHHLKALIEMEYWEKAVVELARSTRDGFSDIPVELTQRIYDKVLENGNAAHLASVLKGTVWTLQEFTNKEVLKQLAMLRDDFETVHWLIRNGTQRSSDQMMELIMNHKTIPVLMKKSVEDKVAYSDISRFHTAVKMRQVNTILQFLQEDHELYDLFQSNPESCSFFFNVIHILTGLGIHDEDVREDVLIRVLVSHRNSRLWNGAVKIMMKRMQPNGNARILPISLLAAVIQSAEEYGITLRVLNEVSWKGRSP